ncbi:hypothetical protein AB0E08_03470 [Streptomyces sp. NPDC048281]|uniref:hypothetical protein n=1 Tax=Streptomyces sp. NPDC048281 TaxID=3154715 RepID=UPI00342D3981
MLMVVGPVAGQWQARSELRKGLGEAQPVARVDVYCSETLRIKRVVTLTAGTYFIVTESDVLFDEDHAAMRRLDSELGVPWRKRVVESDFYDHPHRWFPLSNMFRVHLVHPDFRPEWESP